MTRMSTMCIVAMLAASLAPAVSGTPAQSKAEARSSNVTSKAKFVIDFEGVKQGHWMKTVDGETFHIYTRPVVGALTTDNAGPVGGSVKAPYLSIEGRQEQFKAVVNFSDRPASLSLDYAFNIHSSAVGTYSFYCKFSDGSEKKLDIDPQAKSSPGKFECEARGGALINEVLVSVPATAHAADEVFVDNITGN
jgi:hypothetical protein